MTAPGARQPALTIVGHPRPPEGDQQGVVNDPTVLLTLSDVGA